MLVPHGTAHARYDSLPERVVHDAAEDADGARDADISWPSLDDGHNYYESADIGPECLATRVRMGEDLAQLGFTQRRLLGFGYSSSAHASPGAHLDLQLQRRRPLGMRTLAIWPHNSGERAVVQGNITL